LSGALLRSITRPLCRNSRAQLLKRIEQTYRAERAAQLSGLHGLSGFEKVGRLGWSKVKLTEIDNAVMQNRELKRKETQKSRLTSMIVQR
jgi:hypothetical protein